MRATINRLVQQRAAQGEHDILRGYHEELNLKYQSLLLARDEMSKEAADLNRRATENKKSLHETHTELVEVAERLRNVTSVLTDTPLPPDHAYAERQNGKTTKPVDTELKLDKDAFLGNSGKAPEFLITDRPKPSGN